jgi:hypothetical protein
MATQTRGWTHGASGYRTYGCRCATCTTAHTERHRNERANRIARLKADPSLAPHGRAETYKNWGCRCERCTDAHSRRCAEYKRRRRERQGVA